jgi:hypothetical protein
MNNPGPELTAHREALEACVEANQQLLALREAYPELSEAALRRILRLPAGEAEGVEP